MDLTFHVILYLYTDTPFHWDRKDYRDREGYQNPRNFLGSPKRTLQMNILSGVEKDMVNPPVYQSLFF
jgi:hypothetical protein